MRAPGKLAEFSARLFQGNECESPYVPFYEDAIRNPWNVMKPPRGVHRLVFGGGFER